MKKGKIELRHTFEGETGYIILRWFKTDSPSTQATGYVTGSGLGVQDATTVSQVYYPAPHTEESLLIENLDPVMFNVKAYRSTDGITPTEQIFTLACDASENAAYASETFEYVVDRGNTNVTEGTGDQVWADPVNGQNQLRDERLLNGNYAVFMRGIGQRRADEITDRSDAGGGFDLAVTDENFNPNDTIFVTLQSRVDIITTVSGSGSGEVNDIVLITEDTDFDSLTMDQKLLYAAGEPTTNIVLSFANLLTISDCTFKVSTQGGNQLYLGLQLDVGDSVRFRGEDKNVVWLGKCEHISIIIRNNEMFILMDGTGYSKLGQRIWGDKLEINTLYRDGTEYNQADYPRVMEFIDALPGANVLSYASWATDKGKFARDDIAGTFKVPDDRNQFIRSLASVTGVVDSERTTQGAGGKQDQSIRPHTHTGVPLKVADVDRGGGSSLFSLDDNGSTDLTGTNIGNETRPVNVGLLPLLCI